MKMDSLSADFQRCNLSPEILCKQFLDWKSLPQRVKGVYSIWQDETAVYVGKGTGIRSRIKHHNNKARSIEAKGTRHTSGWIHHRSTNGQWNPDAWVIEYAEVSSAVHRTYLEGAMLLKFRPLCNSEVFAEF